MTYLLKLLLAFLSLLVEGGGDEGAAEGGAEGGAEGATEDGKEASEGGDSTLDDFLDDAEEGMPGRKPKADPQETPAEKRARERIEVAEQRAANAERLAMESAQARTVPRTDPVFEREEAQLADARSKGGDTSWLEWKIGVDRNNRAIQTQVAQERFQAEDARDRAAFERIETTHPKVFKRYQERVEKARADWMAKGQAFPRAALLRLFVGDDALAGKIGHKKQKPAEQEKESQGRQVERGRPTSARTDVSRKGGGKDEQAARRERLRDFHI